MIRRIALLVLVLLAACSTYPANTASRPGESTPVETQGFPDRIAGEIPAVQGDLFSVHLYRHAEKLTGPDPELTTLGHARARHLAERLSQPAVAISQVWSSPYQRTLQTAQPLADQLGIDVKNYDPRNLQDLASSLREAASDAAVFGHSNTTPELAAMLCDCDVRAMPESDYETAYIVVLGHGISELYELDMRRTWADRPQQED